MSDDVTVRTLAGRRPQDYLAYAGPGTVDVAGRLDGLLERGHYRPEWMWLACRAGRVVARAAFWCWPGEPGPAALDHFDLRQDEPDRVAAGTRLLQAAYAAAVTQDGNRPDYHLFLPPRWRDQPDAAAAHERVAAAEAAGLALLVERHRIEWTPDCGLPPDSGRLAFRTVTDADGDLLVDLLARIVRGSLDAGTVREARRVGAVAAARRYLRDMDGLPTPRSWWLLGYADGADPVGVAMPARNAEFPIVGFVGVAPEARGRGYALDLLVESTRRLAERGATAIRADTDVTNLPMVGVFARAGWRVFATRIVMEHVAEGA
jgi:ribosomal protein S18 acetylase RimI-like enzyme